MPIRILHIVTQMNRGGLETMLMNYYRHIDRDMVQFDFMVHRQERAAYDDEIEALGGRIYRVSRLIPWSSQYKKELRQFFTQHPEYKVVHVHQDCLSSVALKAAKDAGVPVRIGHSHSSSQDKNIKYLIKLFYKQFISKYATELFACGKEAGDWMFGGADYQIVNNAIDTAAYTFSLEKRAAMRSDLGINDDEFVVGHVGRFSPAKNHMFLIEVFAEILKKEPNAKLLLVGDGELRSSIEKKISELGIEDRVIFAGVRSDVPELLQAMDVFVMPSLYEGVSVAAVEAQAAGLPCFISDRVPPDCILTDLVQQLPLTATPPPIAWADAVLQAKNAKRINTYQQIAEAGFDIQQNAKKLQEQYLRMYENQ